MQGSLLLMADSEIALGAGRRHSFSISTDGVQLALAATSDREILDWLDCVRTQLDVLREQQQQSTTSPVLTENLTENDDDDDDGDDDSWETDDDNRTKKSFSEV